MSDILFNKSGVPLIAYGKSYQATTTGTPAVKPKNTSQPTKNPDEDILSVGNIQVSAWGPANDFPKKADEIINSVGVLNTELKFTRNFTMGQHICMQGHRLR